MAGLNPHPGGGPQESKRQNVEWFDKFDIDVDGESFPGRIYLFRKRGKTRKRTRADSYRKDEGIVFTYNGQCQAFFSKDFFRRKAVRLDTLGLPAGLHRLQRHQRACPRRRSCQTARTCDTAT